MRRPMFLSKTASWVAGVCPPKALLLLFLLSVVGRQAPALSGKIVFETNRDGND